MNLFSTSSKKACLGLYQCWMLDAAVHRFDVHRILAAVVDLAGQGAAHQVLFHADAELVVDGAVDRAPLDAEGRLAVELDVDGAVDRLRVQVAAQQGLLGELDGAVDGLEGAGAELAGEIDLAVHGLQSQIGELAGAIELAVDRLEFGPGQLLGDGDGEIDLGPGVALVVLDLDPQRVAALLEDHLDVLYFPFVVGLLDSLDVDGRSARGHDLDRAVDIGQLDRATGGQMEAFAYLLLVVFGREHREHEQQHQSQVFSFLEHVAPP